MPLIAGLVIIGENLAMPHASTSGPERYWYHRKGDTDFIIPTKLDIGNNRTNKY